MGRAGGGGAWDPETGIFYVKASNSPALFRLRRNEEVSDTVNADYLLASGRTPSVRMDSLLAARGLGSGPAIPLNKPPYGSLTAIDLNSGEHLWQRPVGDNPSLRNHPLLRELNLPPLGVAGAPGPIVTAGGLVFLSGGSASLFAFDKTTGALLWEKELGRSAYSVPMTYGTSDGRQFVVIATGSGSDARLMAFALAK